MTGKGMTSVLPICLAHRGRAALQRCVEHSPDDPRLSPCLSAAAISPAAHTLCETTAARAAAGIPAWLAFCREFSEPTLEPRQGAPAPAGKERSCSKSPNSWKSSWPAERGPRLFLLAQSARRHEPTIL